MRLKNKDNNAKYYFWLFLISILLLGVVIMGGLVKFYFPNILGKPNIVSKPIENKSIDNQANDEELPANPNLNS